MTKKKSAGKKSHQGTALTKAQKRGLLATRIAREEPAQPARDIVRGPDESFEHPPAVTLTAGELRAYLQMALNFDRSAERTLLAYFRNCWELAIEPDAFVLREYCDQIFEQALDRFKIDPRRGRPEALLIVGPKHRPRKNFGLQAATHLHVAALFTLLRKDGRGEALKRTAMAFNISEKMVEKIATDQEQRLGDHIRRLAESERDCLLRILETPFGKSMTYLG